MNIKRRWKIFLNKTLLVSLVWFIVALVISSITFLNQLQGNYSLTLSPGNVILFEVACIIPWAICTPLIVWVARSYPLEKYLLSRSIPAHFLTALFVFVFHSVVQSYQVFVFYESSMDWAYLKRDFLGFLDMRMMLYAGVVLSVYVIDFQRKERKSRLKEPRLKARLAKARYQAILNQVQPAFLLDSIDTIRENVRFDADESEQILTDFSDLLRIMLQNTEREEVPIQEDLESYRLYVRLLEKRLGTEIECVTHVDEACAEAMAPSSRILISLIEELLSADRASARRINRLSYTATCSHSKVYIRLSIGGLELFRESLWSYLKVMRFTDIRRHLSRMYGNKAGIEVRVDTRALNVQLRFPLMMEGQDEEPWAEIYADDTPEYQPRRQ